MPKKTISLNYLVFNSYEKPALFEFFHQLKHTLFYIFAGNLQLPFLVCILKQITIIWRIIKHLLCFSEKFCRKTRGDKSWASLHLFSLIFHCRHFPRLLIAAIIVCSAKQISEKRTCALQILCPHCDVYGNVHHPHFLPISSFIIKQPPSKIIITNLLGQIKLCHFNSISIEEFCNRQWVMNIISQSNSILN